MAVVTMRQLLESGVHFGHQTRRWNPKMKRFIMTERNGIYIIDLQQSLSYIDTSYAFIKDTVAKGGTIMFVGTKKQAQQAIAEQATRVGMPFVNQRWLGGMLTNFQTVHQRINRLKELDDIDFDDVAGSGRTKKELLHMRREQIKLDKTLGGIRDMSRTPSAVWIVDTNKEHLAVEEARKLHIPIIAILDSNCDPDLVDYPIPGNDDAIRAVGLLTRVIADAVADGLIARSGAKSGDEADKAIGSDEPLADWERDLLQGQEGEKVDEAAVAATGGDTATEETPAAEATGAAAEATEAKQAETAAAEAPAETRRGGRDPGRDPAPRPRPTPPTATPPWPSRPPRSRTSRPRLLPRPRAAEAADGHRRGRRDDRREEGGLSVAITAADVKKLRELTGAGMMDCKKALEEAEGDFDKAAELLRIKLGKKAAARGAEREATSGLVATSGGALVELKSETDFVAKNDDFVAAAQRIADAAAEAKAADTESLKSVPLDGKTVGEVVEELAITIGEKIELGQVAYFDGQSVVYMHKRAADLPPAVGVLVEYDGTDADAARGAAMQIAAMKPQYLSRDDVPADVVEKEREIGAAIAREEGKPEQAIEKIAEGRLNGFFKDVALLDQPSVTDSKKNVKAVLDAAGVEVKRFARFEVGA